MREFEELLQENLVPLERYVKFKIGDLYDAEDIIQEVCLAATAKYESLKNRSSFKAWLIGIASNKCKDYYRRKANEMELPIDVLSSYPKSAIAVISHPVCSKSLGGLK